MAFGGREIRLALSVQSYGTTNLRNLRRDLAGLQSYTDAANRQQATLMARNARDVKKYATVQRQIDVFPAKRAALAEKELGIKSQIAAADARSIKAQQAFMTASQRNMAGLRRAASFKMPLTDTKYFRSLGANAKMFALQWQAADLALRKGEAQLARMPEEAAMLARQEAIVNDTLAKQAAQLGINQAELAKMQAQVIPLAKRLDQATQMERVGRQVAHVGRMMQFAGLLVSAAFGMAASSFANFTNEASLAGTQMRDIGAPISQAVNRAKFLSSEILNLMTEFPATSEEMSKAAYDIFSSMDIVKNGVVNVSQGMNLLKLANKAAVAGGVDLAESTNTLITVLNNFDPALKQVGSTINTVFAIVRFGRMHMDDFGAAMQKIAPIAKTTGLSLKDVGGAFAALTIMFPRVQDAAAGLARAIELFRYPQVQKGLEAWGVKITDAKNRLLPLYDVIGRLIKRFPEMATSQKSALEVMMQITKLSGMTKVGIQGTVQARRAIAALAANYALYGDVLKNVTNSKGEFDAAFAARMQDPGVQWQIFLNTMRALVLMIGKEALPVFLKVGKTIAGFVQWFKELNPTVKRLIVQFSAISGLFFLFGGTIVNVVGSLIALKANMVIAGLSATDTAARFAFLKYTIGTLALLGLGTLLADMIGLRKAIVYTTAAWLVWKTGAIQAIGAVVAASITGAAATAAAWRTALMRTGFGLLVIASAIAIEQIMAHWNQVLAFFIALWAALKTGWKSVMDYMVGVTAIGISKIQNHWYNFLNQMVPFLGDAAKKIDEMFGTGPKSMEAWGRRMVEQSKAPETFRKEYNRAMAKFAKDRKKNGDDFQKWLNEYQDYASKFVTADFLKQQEAFADQLLGGKKGDKMAKARADAVKQATTEMENTVKSATDNMMNIWRNFYQQNVQALGGIFQGPMMQGIFGNIFSQLNSTLKQFGVIIPVPFNILKQDLDMSVKYFMRWRADINKLLKAGVPLGMVQEIEAMGPDAGIPIAEGLLSGGKKGIKQIIAQWKKMHGPGGALEQATKQDMNRQLADWKKHGDKAAWAMVSGFGQAVNDPKLRAQFSAYITNNFASILNKQFSDSVNTAVQEAAAQAADAAATMTPPKFPGYEGGGGAGGGGGGKPKTRTPLQRAVAARNAAYKELTARKQAFAALGKWAVDPRSGGGIVITGKEQQALNRLEAERLYWANVYRQSRRRVGREREMASIRRQMHQQDVRNPRHANYTITYGGDTVTIKADGATPQAVMRALNKKAAQRRARRKKNPATKP